MRFTEAEAKAKMGQWVRVRDASLGQQRLALGRIGQVTAARRLPREGGEGQEEGWGVCIEFSLSSDQSISVLLRDVGKAQYERSLEEREASV